MDINNLYVGQVFNNYKELCLTLNIPIKNSTNSKKAQFRDLECYCKFHQDVRKIIIDEVYDEPKEKLDGRGKSEGSRNNNDVYGDKIRLLTLDLLAQCRDGQLSISRGKLMLAINMINENYSACGELTSKLSQHINIDEEIIYDFYNTCNSNFKKTVESALKRLMDERIIWVEMVTKVSELGTYKTRLADNEEKDLIRDTEREALIEFGYKSMTDVRCSKDWRSFKKSVKNKLQELSNIDFYYFAYDIRFNYDSLEEERQDSHKYLLNEIEREEQMSELNATVYFNFVKNAEKRHEKGFTSSKSKKFRIQDNYVDDIKTLLDLLINRSQGNIISEIINIKVEECNVTDEELDDLFA